MVLGKLDRHMQRNETRSLYYTLHKNQLKWIKDLNVRPEIIKFLEDNIGSKLLEVGLSNIFVDPTPKSRETEAKVNKWDYIKL